MVGDTARKWADRRIFQGSQASSVVRGGKSGTGAHIIAVVDAAERGAIKADWYEAFVP